MPNIPDITPDKYDRIVVNYQQLRRKLKKLDDAYIDATNNKELFKEMRNMFKDIVQLTRLENGIQKDDDREATTN